MQNNNNTAYGKNRPIGTIPEENENYLEQSDSFTNVNENCIDFSNTGISFSSFNTIPTNTTTSGGLFNDLGTMEFSNNSSQLGMNPSFNPLGFNQPIANANQIDINIDGLSINQTSLYNPQMDFMSQFNAMLHQNNNQFMITRINTIPTPMTPHMGTPLDTPYLLSMNTPAQSPFIASPYLSPYEVPLQHNSNALNLMSGINNDDDMSFLTVPFQDRFESTLNLPVPNMSFEDSLSSTLALNQSLSSDTLIPSESEESSSKAQPEVKPTTTVLDSLPDPSVWNKIQHQGQTLYQCPYEQCGKTFTRPYNLKSHYRGHTGERPYACDAPNCSLKFARKYDLKRHQKLHTGAKPFVCTVCSKAFVRSDYLKRHQRVPEVGKESECDIEVRKNAQENEI
ncbi:hypothetical protein HDV02_002319 [Globomyces sp. JEL0801]|nr:hypothetical protein HDV02_002319 [Globomyces sp. JEL0801]